MANQNFINNLKPRQAEQVERDPVRGAGMGTGMVCEDCGIRPATAFRSGKWLCTPCGTPRKK